MGILELISYKDHPLSTQTLLQLLNGYSRPYDKIMEWVKQGYLIQLRRGLYMTSSLVSSTGAEPFSIANHLYGPSYVSLESALFYWGLIPERVYGVTSCTIKLSRKIMSNQSVYSYYHLPTTYYSLGLMSIAIAEKQVVLIASKEKCLCDKIIATSGINLRSKRQVVSFLIEDLRMDERELKDLNLQEMTTWLQYCPKQKSIEMVINAIAEL